MLLKKEEINPLKMEDKIAVVLDVLLATSTITACFSYGAKEVYPVVDEAEARSLANKMVNKDVCLVGEFDGQTIEQFLDPTPLSLREHMKGKSIILSTTNGTVAIRKASNAKKVFICSLLNGRAVAKEIAQAYENETIIVICSGSKNKFSLEDFYGAGYFISQLADEREIKLTDSALTAKLFYEQFASESKQMLTESKVGKKLTQIGIGDDVEFVSMQGIITVIPQLVNNRLINY
ncbi:2-phosphosulfolactate phosphatase [Bacillus aquiflavi]|nr:2-phosphosulfolactate phosphatase [Bacillus aquiflavi]